MADFSKVEQGIIDIQKSNANSLSLLNQISSQMTGLISKLEDLCMNTGGDFEKMRGLLQKIRKQKQPLI